jgi:hypothetical protein
LYNESKFSTKDDLVERKFHRGVEFAALSIGEKWNEEYPA